MKLEKHVTTLKQSKKFIKLGIKVDSLFSYSWDWISQSIDDSTLMLTSVVANSWDSIQAPTITELMDILPHSIKVEDRLYELRVEKAENYYNICYWCDFKKDRLLVSINGDLRDTLADVLIFLIKGNHLKVEEDEMA